MKKFKSLFTLFLAFTLLAFSFSSKISAKTTNTIYVALTFDDGPSSTLTPKLLDALEKYNAKATFFLVGNMISYDENTVKRAYDLGNEIGSHSYDHADLTKLSKNDIKLEIKRTSDSIKSITGADPTLFRVPYGNHNKNVDKIITSYNLPIILWNVDTEDWKYKDADLVYENIKSNLVDGNVILMHDLYSTSIDAVTRILKDYSNKGYKFVTVSELAAIKNTDLAPGKTYYSF